MERTMMAGFFYCFMVAVSIVCAPWDAYAQQNKTTLSYAQTITLGNTYQLVRPATNRWSITVQNNNTTTDNCYLIIGTNQVTPGSTAVGSTITINGVSLTAAKASILLAPGASWARYFPYVPSDPIYATCATTGDSLYVDEQ